jgi:hypothetical protein
MYRNRTVPSDLSVPDADFKHAVEGVAVPGIRWHPMTRPPRFDSEPASPGPGP